MSHTAIVSQHALIGQHEQCCNHTDSSSEVFMIVTQIYSLVVLTRSYKVCLVSRRPPNNIPLDVHKSLEDHTVSSLLNFCRQSTYRKFFTLVIPTTSHNRHLVSRRPPDHVALDTRKPLWYHSGSSPTKFRRHHTNLFDS